MTTNTIKSFVSEAFTNLPKSYVDFKERYCPSGQTCNDIATIGGLAFMVWFMYIALQPIIRF
jgi:hypothetical protein